MSDDKPLEVRYIGLASIEGTGNTFNLAPLKTEGAWQNYATGEVVTDPDEIARLESERDAKLEAERTQNSFVFSSGRRVYVPRLSVAIDPDLQIAGEDGGDLSWPPQEDWFAEEGDAANVPTAGDMRELADIMIDRWTRFKASLPE